MCEFAGCPVCEGVADNMEEKPCLRCKGLGKIGYDDDGEEWDFGTEFNTGGWDLCPDCEGEGKVWIEKN